MSFLSHCVAAGLVLSVVAGMPVISPAASTLTTSTLMTSPWITDSSAQWIWPADARTEPNQYANFIQDFDVASLDGAGTSVTMAISADSNYAVWLNGQFISWGQWSNFPDDKTYDTLDLTAAAKPGRNRLCVTGYWQGQSSSTYSKGEAGLLYAVASGEKVLASSGPETFMRRAIDYKSGPVPHVTGQLGFTFQHEGHKADGWLTADYQPGTGWVHPTQANSQSLADRPIRPRPIPKLELLPRLPMHLVAQGAFLRNEPKAAPADAMQSDSLAFRKAGELIEPVRKHLTGAAGEGVTLKSAAWAGQTGAYLMLDTGAEEAGLLDLELDAPAGTVIDIGYGEHLDDLRVRSEVGRRNFGVRHVCPGGPHQFMHPFLRLAGRYIQLQITPGDSTSTAPISITYAGLRPTEYPVERLGKFESSDSLHNKIWEVSRRTLELCMHEHYEDCPWREQALYAMDGRNQALAGYYCFGNYDFAKESIRLLGQSLNPDDGFLELCAPAKVSITIPSFSLAWILMLDDHLLFRGDREFVKSQLPIARQILETCARETSGSIIATPRGKRMWNFYEWAPGLDGGGFEVVTEQRFESPLNLFYLLALDATARMAAECGEDGTTYSAKAAALRSEFMGTFWDEDQKGVATFVGKNVPRHFAELTQALSIIADVIPQDKISALRQRLAADNNGLVPCTISHTLYKFEALLTDPDKYGKRVFDLIERDWGYMLGKGATSFWETIEGADAFGQAGSLCHGWSGVPAWFYGAYILGVKPTAPGFSQYKQEPLQGVFHSAIGTVPTPDGVIEVRP